MEDDMLVTILIDSYLNLDSLLNTIDFINDKFKKIEFEIIVHVHDENNRDVKKILGYIYEHRICNLRLYTKNDDQMQNKATGEMIVNWVGLGENPKIPKKVYEHG